MSTWYLGTLNASILGLAVEVSHQSGIPRLSRTLSRDIFLLDLKNRKDKGRATLRNSKSCNFKGATDGLAYLRETRSLLQQ